METVLLLLKNENNSLLLQSYLQNKYKVKVDEKQNDFKSDFDLCIIDGPNLKTLKNKIAARKVLEKEIFLPVLLVTAKKEVGMMTDMIWQSIDEVISIPIQKSELYARIEVLLRSRRLSNDLMVCKEAQLAKVNEALIQSEEIYKAMITCTPLATYSLDYKGNVTSWNRAAEELLGWSSEEVIGKSLPSVPPDRKAEFENLISRTINGTSVSGLEIERRHKDGSILQCSLSSAPVRDHEGNIIGVMAAMENISARKKTEKELQESEARFRSLFQDNHAVMLLIDSENGKIVDVNRAAESFYGWSKKELTQKHIHDINILSSEEIENEMLAAKSQKRNYFHFKHKINNGHITDVEVYSGPIDIMGRNLLYSIIFDISDRIKIEAEKKQLNKQLIQAQKMEAIGQLAGGIAHDFNNILSAIIGFTELSLGDVPKNSLIEDNLQEIYKAGTRAKDLVAQILTFAHRSDQQLSPVRVDLIAKEALKFIRSSIPTTIAIKSNLNSVSRIMGNQTQVHQIFMNLFTNAAFAMENKGGLLTVSIADIFIDDHVQDKELEHGNYIQIVVSDTGTGIHPKIINTIFDPYFTTKKSGEGTGMGLAMVHGIVESYSGKIVVKSELGSGTAFTIYIPITTYHEKEQAYEPEFLPNGAERILFVDDEEAIAKLGARLFKELGYFVTPHTSSLEALEMFRSKPNEFDLVITDMTMPDLTGDKLAIELMKIRTDIPVIICTGYSKKITRESAAEIGIKALAEKPLKIESLAKTVRSVLEQAKSIG